MTLAHTAIEPGQLWTTWSFDVVTIGALVLSPGLYARGLRRLWRRGHKHTVRPRQAISFYAALLLIAVALVSPLDALASTLVSAHMVQHLVFLILAPPLLVYARPGLVVGVAFPPGAHRSFNRMASAPAVAATKKLATTGIVAVSLHAAAMWLWHLPGPYQAAVANDALHAIEHVSFLVTALLFWSVVIQPRARRRVSFGAAISYAFAVWIISGGLGAILSFATHPLYPELARHAPAWGLAPLTDQQLAGVIMWIPAGLVYLVAMASLGMRGLLGTAVLLVTFALGSCSYASDSGPTHRFAEFPAVDAAPGVGRGKVLYLRDCAWCHGDDAEGTERAPDLLEDPQGGGSVDFMVSSGRMPIDYPDEYVKRREPVYESDEVADIVDYVETLGPEGPPVPEVDIASGSLPSGQQLFNQNCAACHSTTGVGGALPEVAAADLPSDRIPRSANVIPPLFDSTPTQVVEAMQTGPGSMPVFDLDEGRTNAIARYVSYLQAPENRGGASIGGIGPVAEGAVGWLLGLGIMLLVIHAIGTTTKQEEDELR
jgi:putative membrane protein